MWDRLTTPTPTVTPESTFRQPIRRFTVSRPPRSACRFTCVSALYWLCVSSFPVGFSEDRVLRSGLASEALRVVLRGFVVLPLLTQGQLYAVYLFFTTGGGGSVSLITIFVFKDFRPLHSQTFPQTTNPCRKTGAPPLGFLPRAQISIK